MSSLSSAEKADRKENIEGLAQLNPLFVYNGTGFYPPPKGKYLQTKLAAGSVLNTDNLFLSDPTNLHNQEIDRKM